MDATQAMQETDQIVSGLISNLTSDHREMRTPCDEWNVHELIEHMCSGAHGIAGGLQGQAPPEEAPDLLANGPAAGWAEASGHLTEAATPEILQAMHQMPFGEVPGEAALSVIVADAATHAWDLAQATGQELQMSDELAAFANATWQGLVPAEDRPQPGGFKPALAASDDASPLEQMLAFTGRQG
ncbi:MAG: TIGR03086 family metal-binding protein [Acidimicrobiales bacterium]